MTTPTTVSVRLQLRADTAANWTSANPTLLANELGRETDTGKIKIGDGSTAWSSLAYQAWATLPIAVASGGTGQTSYTNGQLLIGNTTGNTLTKATLTAGSGIAITNGTGSITIAASGISDAQIAADAEIAVSKLADGTARQLLQTDAAGTGVEWASNIDIPGTLDVTSAATFDSTIGASAGTASLPSITFTGDLNTGIYSPGADQVAISTNGTNRFQIDSSGNIIVDTNTFYVDATNNRVGVGTTGPASTLHVVGTGRFVGTQNLLLDGATGTYSTWYYNGTPVGDIGTANTTFSGGSNTDFGITTRSATSLVFGVNSAERARIDTSGRLLVGTSTSRNNDYLLQVEGPLATGGQLLLSNSYTAVTSAVTYGQIGFVSNVGSVASVVAQIRAENDGNHDSATDKPTRLVFSTTADGASSPTERMRIRNDGAVWIGTTTGTINTTNYGTAIGFGAAGAFDTSRNVNGASAVASIFGNAGVAYVMGDGDLENTNNRYTGISDIKFKQNIVDASSQWSDIKQIRVRKYELIASPDRQHIGLIAQELEQICPGLVVEREDRDGESYKSVAYSVLYMKAVKALQEAMERIETLEAKVAALESA